MFSAVQWCSSLEMALELYLVARNLDMAKHFQQSSKKLNRP